jgi:hypothetical protein
MVAAIDVKAFLLAAKIAQVWLGKAFARMLLKAGMVCQLHYFNYNTLHSVQCHGKCFQPNECLACAHVTHRFDSLMPL